ncbi:apolipoprotein D [Bacillus rossius redtenbacheri]|uniref:apolipoprotein D n=1 Tax=Bacillus rossius redtenbacheri TaxID=93214 RepID=UPI002FDEAEC5
MLAPTFGVFLVLAGAEAEAQRLAFGKCPNHPAMKDFDIQKFEGTWYEVERSFYLLEIASSCTKLDIAPVERRPATLNIIIKTVNRWTGGPSVSLGTATLKSNKTAVLDFRMSSRLPTAVARMLPGAGVYHLLHTDYDSFAVLWSCSDLGFMHADLIWVLGRQQDLPVWARAEVYNRLAELNIDSDRLTLSRNKDCPNF